MPVVSEKLSLGAELDINLMQGRSAATAAAAYRFKSSTVNAQVRVRACACVYVCVRVCAVTHGVFRARSDCCAQVNSDGVCAVMLERQLLGPNVTLALCGSVDHAEGKSAFGIGFNINM
jgi:hypothetical protein